MLHARRESDREELGASGAHEAAHPPAGTNAEVRVLADALCLVFLQFQFAALAAKSDDEKMVNALRNSWEKMTETAGTETMKLSFDERGKDLMAQALRA